MNLFFQKTLRQILCFAVFSFLAGLTGGMFGTGGGMLLVFLYASVFSCSSLYTGQDIFAMTVMTVLLLSLPSFFLYLQKGHTVFSHIAPVLFPAFLGGACGALLLEKINPTVLRKIFSVFLLYAGIRLLLK